jgi:hypothetical protein
MLKSVETNMTTEREEVADATAGILTDAHRKMLERQRLAADREWDVYQATAALKAVTGLCTTYGPAMQEESLDCVGRGDLAALLSIICDRLDRSARQPT